MGTYDFLEFLALKQSWADKSSPLKTGWLSWFKFIGLLVWAAPSEFGTYRLCEQRRFRRACASAQSRQNLRCSLIQAVSQEEPSDRKPDPWLLWMAGHAQLKFVMTECSKTQIRLAGLSLFVNKIWFVWNNTLIFTKHFRLLRFFRLNWNAKKWRHNAILPVSSAI